MRLMKCLKNKNMKRDFNLKRIVLLMLIIDVIIVAIPIILNFIINIPSPIPQKYVIGDTKDWLSFWGVYIGSIGSFMMVVVAFFTLIQNYRTVQQNEVLMAQNKEQLDELKRQWEEEHRPRINISIIVYRKAFFIKIKNIGKGNATDIKITFNKEFIKNLLKEEYKQMYYDVEESPFVIEEGEAKYLFIGFCDDIHNKWNGNNVVLKILGTYCNKYHIDETFKMEEYIKQRFMAVKDALWEIADGLSCPNNTHYPIQQSLDVIAKHVKSENQTLSKG